MADTPASFSLIDRPWIPVLDMSGSYRRVSLAEVFAEAGQLRCIAGDLPTQTFALLRLLLAVLHRAVEGPDDMRAWGELWASPGLPIRDITGYLDEFRDRFDLLHPKTPFYQVASLRTEKGEVSGLERLIADVPVNEPYLTNRLGPGLQRISPAEAAVWVVHCQAYDTSGIKTGAVGDPRVKQGKSYPIGPGPCGGLGGVFLEGPTLRETLLLNLIALDCPYLEQEPDKDSPVWERPPHGPAEEDDAWRGPYGVLNLYTWQSRRIRLVGDEHAITGVIIANGDKLTWENRYRHEPMTGWRRRKDQGRGRQGPVYMPALHDPARALWRGLTSLLPTKSAAMGHAGADMLPPALSQWLARLRAHGYLDPSYRVTTRAIGAIYGTKQTVIDAVYHDHLTMTVQAFDADGELATAIVDSVADAEKAVAALRWLAVDLCRAAGGYGGQRSDPPAAAGARAAERGFAELEVHFRQWLGSLGPTTDPREARAQWQTQVRARVAAIGAELVAQAGPQAWVGRYLDPHKRTDYISSAIADLKFRRALNRALPLAAGSLITPAAEAQPHEVSA